MIATQLPFANAWCRGAVDTFKRPCTCNSGEMDLDFVPSGLEIALHE